MESIGTLQRRAQRRGDVLFDPRRPCRHGHTAMRYSLTGRCVQCQREYERRWRASKKNTSETA